MVPTVFKPAEMTSRMRKMRFLGQFASGWENLDDLDDFGTLKKTCQGESRGRRRALMTRERLCVYQDY